MRAVRGAKIFRGEEGEELSIPLSLSFEKETKKKEELQKIKASDGRVIESTTCFFCNICTIETTPELLRMTSTDIDPFGDTFICDEKDN